MAVFWLHLGIFALIGAITLLWTGVEITWQFVRGRLAERSLARRSCEQDTRFRGTTSNLAGYGRSCVQQIFRDAVSEVGTEMAGLHRAGTHTLSLSATAVQGRTGLHGEYSA